MVQLQEAASGIPAVSRQEWLAAAVFA